MKNLFLLIIPALLVGCNAEMEQKAESEEMVAVDQTVFHFDTVQVGSKGLQNIEKKSDEYWQTVTGQELKNGVAVYLTTNDNLIRVAPKATYDNGQVFKAAGVELDQLELFDSQAKRKLNVSQVASQSQMELAGFEDGSVALKGFTNGKNAILKSRQNLADNDTYLIHVKEKNSPYLLDVKSAFSKEANDDSLPIRLTLNSQAMNTKTVSLNLLSPTSEQVDVEFEDNKVLFSHPLEQLGAINGFYEIEANVLTEVNGKKIMRSVKVPFTNEAKTASLGMPKFKANADSVVVDLPIATMMSGRFAVKATLAVQNGSELTPLATVEVAQEIDSYSKFKLPFNVDGASKGQLVLTDVELTDQTRMIKSYPTL